MKFCIFSLIATILAPHALSALNPSTLPPQLRKTLFLNHADPISIVQKTLPFTQPIPLAFGGGQYISSSSGQEITRGKPVRCLKKGYLRNIDLYKKSGTFVIRKSALYNIDYFLSVKLVVDSSKTVSQIMAIQVNGTEIVRSNLTLASSTTFLEGTTLISAIYSGTDSASMYLRKGDHVKIVYSEKSSKPYSGNDRVHVYANNEDLAAAIFFSSEETAES